jgi:ligand-binding sensor domain-containing protein
LNYLQERIITLLGDQEAVVQIHGGVRRDERRLAENRFRNDPDTTILLATDAAGEGINLRWAPINVRGVAYDSRGRLWFASPQGVGCFDNGWTLYTGAEGLPYNDFTTMAAGEAGVVWFGT